jgi:hypothetical protein
MRLTAILDIFTYDNSKPTNDPSNATKMLQRVEVDGITGVNRHILALPDQTEDKNIDLPASTAKYLAICTDQTIKVKLNGSDDEITLSPTFPKKKTPVLFWRGDISALSISNTSGATANVDILMAD